MQPGEQEGRSRAILKFYSANRGLYEDYSQALRRLVVELTTERQLSADVTGRAKSMDSLRRKLETKQYDSAKDVPDLAGIRVIVQTLADVDAVCDMLSAEFQLIEDIPHGFTEQPESFGYASRHLIIGLDSTRYSLLEWRRFKGLRCEIQVRTILQHAWASISHSLDYKASDDVPADVRRKLFQVAALIEVGDALFLAFRNQLDDVRGRYQQKLTQGTWTELPIDLDSLAATWGQLRPDSILEQLVAPANVEILREREDMDAAAELRATVLSAIVNLAEAMRLERIGELGQLFSESGLRARLEAYIAERSGEVSSAIFSFDYLTLVALYLVATSRSTNIPLRVYSLVMPGGLPPSGG